MVAQQPATLLAVLVANSEQTYEEIVDEFLRCARENHEKATLSVRTLQRWMKGRVHTAPRPAQRRVARLYWGYPMATLLAPAPPATSITPAASPYSRTTTHGPTTDPAQSGRDVTPGRFESPRSGRPLIPDAGRAPSTAHAGENSNEEDPMQRRTVLRTLTTLAAATASPAVALEALRHGLDQLADAGSDEWESIAADYAIIYNTLPPAELIKQLGADMTVLEHTLAAKHDTSLYRVAAQLSGMMALALVSHHQVALARRWWRTGHRYADHSGDLETRAWIDGLEVVSGTYEDRPIRQILDLADDATSVIGDHVCRGNAEIWAGRAQALALAGDTKGATDALRMTADLTERMPDDVANGSVFVFSWPEYRLRHTESFVYTHLGLTDEAMRAQDRVLELYPPELAGQRAMVQLHQAKCHILDGDIRDGLTYAANVLDEVPTHLRNAKLHALGRRVVQAVPDDERHRAEYDELRERLLTLPGAR